MRLSTLFTLLFAVTGNAFATNSDLVYTYVDVEYRENSLDRFDGDGFKLEGAYAINDRYFLFSEYSDDGTDLVYSVSTFVPDPNNPYVFVGHVDYEASSTEISVGGGIAFPIGDSVDFVGKVFYSMLDAEVIPGGTYEIIENGTVTETGALCLRAMCVKDEYDHSGFGLEVGVRGAITENFELFGNMRYIDRDFPEPNSTYSYLDAFDTSTHELGLRYSITERFSLGLAASRRGDLNLSQLSARLNF